MSDIKLSVIIPVFNVEEYLEECLQSLIDQDLEEFEAILVDDGSTDGSTSIAEHFTALDNRFRYIRTENLGPGAARNLAISKARGEYLGFLDSDDIIPVHAYSRMYSEARKHDADIVTGNVVRLRDGKYGTARLFEIVFSEYEHLTDFRKSPVLINDSISCDKIIRREFWLENGISYPEGLTFEDVPMTFAAYYYARRVVMLDEIIYYWRVRDGETRSITQQKNLQTVNDRLNALRIVNRFCIDNNVEDILIKAKKYKNLTIDLNVLINKALELDDDTLRKTMTLIKEYMIEDDLEAELGELPLLYEKKYRAILREDMPELKKLRHFQLDTTGCIRTLRAGNKVLGIFPREILPMRIADMRMTIEAELLRQRATKVCVSEESIIITGCAFMRYVPVRKPSDVRMRAWLVDGARSKVCGVTLVQHNTATPFAMEKKKNSNRVAYRGTGYTIELERSRFRELGPGRYKILLGWDACGHYREAALYDLREDDVDLLIKRWNTIDDGITVSATEKNEPLFTVNN